MKNSILKSIYKINTDTAYKNPHKKTAIILCILSTLILSGCSSTKDFILHHSGLMTENEYQNYINLKNTNQLDAEGYYISSEINDSAESLPPDNSIHVTFADNAYLEIEYYADTELTIPVSRHECYLKPDDRIYASIPVPVHPSSNYFSFDRFCIYAYDEDGNKGEELFWKDNTYSENGKSSLNNDDTNSLLVLSVPENYNGAEIAVIPIGEYQKRSIKLNDYYIDSTGNTQTEKNDMPLGNWTVNGESLSKDSIEISPVESLFVDFNYDPEKFAFESSAPSSFYNDKGLVRFETTLAVDNIQEYSVELRPLDEKTFSFDPSDFHTEHGSIEFSYLNEPLKEARNIPDGGVINYVATPVSGYRHPKNTGEIKVNAADPDATNAEIMKEITFYLDGQVSVILPKPIGGIIEYTVNGEILSDDTCTLDCGTVITMNFTPWNGWICNVMDGEKYTVTEQELNQTACIDSVDIYTGVFKESEEHKPTVNVILTDSVKNADFNISATGVPPQNLNYETGDKSSVLPDWAGQNDRVIFNDKIGTDQGLTLTITDDTVLNGCALKLDINMEDQKGNEYHSIRYVKKLPVSETIFLYSDAEAATSSTVFKNIEIIVSKVDVITYQVKKIDHATISVMPTDITESYQLKEGDVFEENREVQITISPASGYYISDLKGTTIYTDTLKYSKWEEDYEKILDKHPVKKIWNVTLDSSDSYGNCVYELDGETVSGNIKIFEGQKLSLNYTLTDSNYQIARNGFSGFWSGLIHKETESVTIPVSESLDGQTIKCSDYITIERKE
ncbi:hypothetical protein AALA90_07520 [Lachnospiraceae bacterium 38-10]